MKRKKLMITMLFIVVLGIVLMPNKVKAVTLQANGGTPATYAINDWLLYIREMQKTGGALGLSDAINENLTSANTNLDIHMEKNTEYGAMAILSASSYGMGSTPIASGGTTTGNATGIKMNINGERVSAALTDLDESAVPRFTSALGRYKNIYTYETIGGKIGDSIDIGAWHNATNNAWFGGPLGIGVAGLLRGYSGSILSYHGTSNNNGIWGGDAHISLLHESRAVVVVGTGI